MNDHIKMYSEIKNEYLLHRIDFAKHFTTVSSALLSLLIALKPASADGSRLFLLAQILLLASILFGAAFLYIVLMQYRRMDSDFLAQLKGMLHNPSKKFEGVFAKYNTTQKVVEKGIYVSFLAAMVCLLLYSW